MSDRRVAIPVYLVMIRIRPQHEGDPNVEVLATKLTRRAADEIASCVPGAWVDKMWADKSPTTPPTRGGVAMHSPGIP